MIRYTEEVTALRLQQRFLPEEFLRQYSQEAGAPVTLGTATLEHTLSDLSIVTFPLLIAGKQQDSSYVLRVNGFGSYDPQVSDVSFSGRHPLINAYQVQLSASRMPDGGFARTDNWINESVVFPGFGHTGEQKKFQLPPQNMAKKRPVMVATATPLEETVVRQLNEILRNF